MAFFPDLDPPLTGAGIAVRAAAERDIPEILIAHQDDPELFRSQLLARPPSGAELGSRVERAAADRVAGAGAWLTIVRAEEDVCRGQLLVHDVDADHRRCELGIWIVPAERGTGLGRAALALVSRWLLTECGLTRVQLLTAPDNEALIRAASAAGFVGEGLLRGYLRGPGGRFDVRVLSLVASDLGAAA